ncbi:zinc finger, CCHC-type containing protein [Tanacetum coccineum]
MCGNHDLSRLDNQSIERDGLNGIGFGLNFVEFISFTFGDKENDFMVISSDTIDLNGDPRASQRMRLVPSALRGHPIIWLDRLPVGSISTWDDLTTHFLAQFFPPERTAKLQNDILMFQQH